MLKQKSKFLEKIETNMEINYNEHNYYRLLVPISLLLKLLSLYEVILELFTVGSCRSTVGVL